MDYNKKAHEDENLRKLADNGEKPVEEQDSDKPNFEWIGEP